MNDIDDPGYDAGARRRLAGLDELLARWAEEAGDRLEIPETGGAIPGTTQRSVEADRGTTVRAGPTGAASGRLRPGSHRWAWQSGILAAAAVVVVVLLTREPERPPPSTVESGIPLVADDLDAASDRSFMVVPTRNPDIAVIWMLDSGD